MLYANLEDNIVAVSSPTADNRVIIRITGPRTSQALDFIIDRPVLQQTGIFNRNLAIAEDLPVGATIYLFQAPHSYTSQTVAEVHIYTNRAVTELVIEKILSNSDVPVRLAGPGEFTARAYLNGKIDLAQAEAVCEIIAGSNKFQIDAAQKLLAGRLSQTTAEVRENLLDCLSLIEAGLDFSGEDIEFITVRQAVETLSGIKGRLEKLISGSISYETVIDLPSVGIAGAANAGKSSLLNRLLGQERSIVSSHRRTTRDVLTGVLEIKTGRCVLFDCAGLTAEAGDILDELAQWAAIEAIGNASAILYCVDVSKADWAEDVSIRGLIKAKTILPVATKSDLLTEKELEIRLVKLSELFGLDFLPISSKTNLGIDSLRTAIAEDLIKAMSPAAGADSIAITERHRQAVADAVENIAEAIAEIKSDSYEVAAMMLRSAAESLSGIEREHIDEQLLDRIFSRFCIGK